MRNLFIIFILIFCWSKSARAIDDIYREGNKFVAVELVSNYDTLPHDDSFLSSSFIIGAHFKIQEGWHIYYLNSGDVGIPTKVSWILPTGFEATPLRWPTPLKIEESGGVTAYGYQNETVLLSSLEYPHMQLTGEQIKVEADVSFLACKQTCLLGKKRISKSFRVAHEGYELVSSDKPLIDRFDSLASPESEISSAGQKAPRAENISDDNILLLMVMAVIAGVILNFMPCVLPVLALKAYSLVNNASLNRNIQRKAALGYFLGVQCAFLGLALVTIALRGIGLEIGWGFQFQNPQFLYCLAIVVFLFSLACFDFYNIILPNGHSLNRLVNTESNLLKKSFLEGILATILATPCGAPLLGTVLAVALTTTPVMAFTLFASIGLGLALPYVVICLNSGLSSWLPAPGAWMITLKKVMGALLMVTALWLISVLNKLIPGSAVDCLILLAGLTLVLWFYKALCSRKAFQQQRSLRPAAFFLSLLIMASSIYVYFPKSVSLMENKGNEKSSSRLINWQPYSSELIEQCQRENKPVFIMFTADWCLTCKFNERFIIETETVAQAIRDNGVVPIKGDWTDGDEKITKALEAYGVRWVPFYVILPPHYGQPVFPGTIFTPYRLAQLLTAGAGQ